MRSPLAARSVLRLVQPALAAVVHTRVWGAIVGRRPYCAGVQLLQQCAMAVGSRCVCCGAVLLVSWYYIRLPQPGAMSSYVSTGHIAVAVWLRVCGWRGVYVRVLQGCCCQLQCCEQQHLLSCYVDKCMCVCEGVYVCMHAWCVCDRVHACLLQAFAEAARR